MTRIVTVIDYGSGNLRSVAKALETVGQGCAVRVASEPGALKEATHLVLPGVGAFASCMNGLTSVPNLLESLEEEVLGEKKPFLGICVGMQMLLERGREHGDHKGLGWIPGEVVALEPKGGLKVPHMGWNNIGILQPQHPLLKGIAPGAHAYFVHSYHARCHARADIAATTEYGGEVAAILARGHIMGTQFHPEKSQETGLRLLRNFLDIPSPF